MSNKLITRLISSGKSTQALATGNLERVAGAGGRGAFAVGTDNQGNLTVDARFNEIVRKNVEGNKIRSPLKDLYKPNGGKTNRPLVFPTDLDNDHYMAFHIMERKRPTRKELGTKRAIRSIILPIPSELQVQYGAEYSNETLGTIGALASGAAGAGDVSNGLADLGSTISSKIAAAKDAFKTKDTDAAIKALALFSPAIAAGAGTVGLGALAGVFAGAATGGGVVSGATYSEGLTLNPHLAVLFKGVDFKEHAFAYRLVARNQKESQLIQNIIKSFKYHMHPGYLTGGSNLAFRYPDEFEIEFSQSIRDNLYDIKPCVLKNFSVNYNGENIPLFFEDTGAPVVIDITLAFQETRIQTRDDLDEPSGD